MASQINLAHVILRWTIASALSSVFKMSMIDVGDTLWLQAHHVYLDECSFQPFSLYPIIEAHADISNTFETI